MPGAKSVQASCGILHFPGVLRSPGEQVRMGSGGQIWMVNSVARRQRSRRRRRPALPAGSGKIP